MLNKEIHKERIGSTGFRILRADASPSIPLRRGKRDEGAWGMNMFSSELYEFETLEALTNHDSMSPQNQSAYDEKLTNKQVQPALAATLLSSNLPSADGGDPGNTGKGGENVNSVRLFLLNNLIDPTLIDLSYIQTQTERINKNKNRIDKQPKPKCQSTNIKNKFCELNRVNVAKSTNRSPLQRGMSRVSGTGGSHAGGTFKFSITEPY